MTLPGSDNSALFHQVLAKAKISSAPHTQPSPESARSGANATVSFHLVTALHTQKSETAVSSGDKPLCQ